MRNCHLCQRPTWGTIPCRLSATACSIYSQLPSTSGDHALHPQPEDTSGWVFDIEVGTKAKVVEKYEQGADEDFGV